MKSAMKKILSLCAVSFAMLAAPLAHAADFDKKTCTFKGKKLYGKTLGQPWRINRREK